MPFLWGLNEHLINVSYYYNTFRKIGLVGPYKIKSNGENRIRRHQEKTTAVIQVCAGKI